MTSSKPGKTSSTCPTRATALLPAPLPPEPPDPPPPRAAAAAAAIRALPAYPSPPPPSLGVPCRAQAAPLTHSCPARRARRCRCHRSATAPPRPQARPRPALAPPPAGPLGVRVPATKTQSARPIPNSPHSSAWLPPLPNLSLPTRTMGTVRPAGCGRLNSSHTLGTSLLCIPQSSPIACCELYRCPPPPCEQGSIIRPLLQMRKLRHSSEGHSPKSSWGHRCGIQARSLREG